MNDEQVYTFSTEAGTEIMIKPLTDEDTVWLTFEQLCRLLQKPSGAVSKRISSVLEDGELKEEQVKQVFMVMDHSGHKIPMDHYNLELLSAVGYRFKSKQAMKFRKWALKMLKKI